MQALFIFLVIFFGIFGAAVFLRLVFNAALKKISTKREECEHGGKRK